MKFWRRHQLKRGAIARLRLNDATALAGVHQRSFPRPWSRGDFEAMMSMPTHHAFGMKIDGTLAAFLLLRYAADEVEVLTLATHPSWRGLGISEKLMLHGFGQAMALGAKRMHLEVESANRPAVALYRKLGFSETGRRAKYYESSDGGDAILMARELI